MKKLADSCRSLLLALRCASQHGPLGCRCAEEELDGACAEDLRAKALGRDDGKAPRIAQYYLAWRPPGQDNVYTMFAGSYPNASAIRTTRTIST